MAPISVIQNKQIKYETTLIPTFAHVRPDYAYFVYFKITFLVYVPFVELPKELMPCILSLASN